MAMPMFGRAVAFDSASAKYFSLSKSRMATRLRNDRMCVMVSLRRSGSHFSSSGLMDDPDLILGLDAGHWEVTGA